MQKSTRGTLPELSVSERDSNRTTTFAQHQVRRRVTRSRSARAEREKEKNARRAPSLLALARQVSETRGVACITFRRGLQRGPCAAEFLTRPRPTRGRRRGAVGAAPGAAAARRHGNRKKSSSSLRSRVERERLTLRWPVNGPQARPFSRV